MDVVFLSCDIRSPYLSISALLNPAARSPARRLHRNIRALHLSTVLLLVWSLRIHPTILQLEWISITVAISTEPRTPKVITTNQIPHSN